jgi:hypothetical protein
MDVNENPKPTTREESNAYWGGPWRCFHCDEVFRTRGGAEDHFGKYINSTPGCILKVQFGDERGLLMELRRVQEENEHLRQQMNEEYWSMAAYAAHLKTHIQSYRPFRKCDTLQDVFHVYDSMEGRALAAEERLSRPKDEPCPRCDTAHAGCCCGSSDCGYCGTEKQRSQ